jgi:hypothetical protein
MFAISPLMSALSTTPSQGLKDQQKENEEEELARMAKSQIKGKTCH